MASQTASLMIIVYAQAKLRAKSSLKITIGQGIFRFSHGQSGIFIVG